MRRASCWTSESLGSWSAPWRSSAPRWSRISAPSNRGPSWSGSTCGNEVAVRGWVEGSGADLVDLAQRFEGIGVAALIVTEIARDGTLEGPAFAQLLSVLEASTIPLSRGGGVGSVEDLRALVALEGGGRRLAGVIAGRAIYEGRFTVEQGLAAMVEAGGRG